MTSYEEEEDRKKKRNIIRVPKPCRASTKLSSNGLMKSREVTQSNENSRGHKRGHKWSIKIFQSSQNHASAQSTHKILVGARLLVVACSVEVGY